MMYHKGTLEVSDIQWIRRFYRSAASFFRDMPTILTVRPHLSTGRAAGTRGAGMALGARGDSVALGTLFDACTSCSIMWLLVTRRACFPQEHLFPLSQQRVRKCVRSRRIVNLGMHIT